MLAVLFLLITGGARALGGRLAASLPCPGAGFPSRLAFCCSSLAMRVYVGRFDLLFEHHTIFDGVTYTDAHVTLTGLLIVCVALVLGAVIAHRRRHVAARAGAGCSLPIVPAARLLCRGSAWPAGM